MYEIIQGINNFFKKFYNNKNNSPKNRNKNNFNTMKLIDSIFYIITLLFIQ